MSRITFAREFLRFVLFVSEIGYVLAFINCRIKNLRGLKHCPLTWAEHRRQELDLAWDHYAQIVLETSAVGPVPLTYEEVRREFGDLFELEES